MTDKDLYPCPWCRGELVETFEYDGPEEFDQICIQRMSCGMHSPYQETADKARQVYNVIAKLVDDIFKTIHLPYLDNIKDYSTLTGIRQNFLEARREHAPY